MSLLSIISEGERRYICDGINMNLRSDGRSCDDYQLITVERNVTHNCDGSAHVRSGHNDILVGIKLEVEEVERLDEWDQCGRVDFSADITANASPMFEGRQGEDISDLLIAMFSEAIPQCLDLKSLVVVPNRYFWVIHVDIVVLECGSLPSLIDSAAIAVKSALFDTKIPKVSPVTEESSDYVVSEDEFESKKLDVSRVPLFVTLTRISSNYVVDVSREEDEASVSSVSLAVSSTDGIVYIRKVKSGSLNTEPLKDVLEKAIEIGKSLDSALMTKLMSDSENKGKLSFAFS